MCGSATRIYVNGRLESPRCDVCEDVAVAVRGLEKGSPTKSGKTEWARCSRHVLESHDPPQKEEASFV